MKRWFVVAVALALVLSATTVVAGITMAQATPQATPQAGTPQAGTPQGGAAATTPQGNTAWVRAVHAVPGAPAVDVLVNNNPVFCNLPFRGVTRYASLPAGSATLALVPSAGGAATTGTPAAGATGSPAAGMTGSPAAGATGSPAAGMTGTPGVGAGGAAAGTNQTPVASSTVNLRGGTVYSAMAMGTTGNISTVLLTDDISAPPSGQAKVRIVHASPDAPAVDVLVQGGPTLASNLAFRSASSYATVPAGTYTIQVRPTGQSNVVLTVPNVQLSSGVVYAVYAVGLVNGQPSLQALPTIESVNGLAVPTAP